MDKLKMMDTIKRIYGSGGNIVSYLRDMEGQDSNTLEDILISYDFQAGTYNGIPCLTRQNAISMTKFNDECK